MEHQIHEIDKHTWMIIEKNPICDAYFYLLEGTREAILIDAGFGSLDLGQICSSLTKKPVSVILTHGHVDHIGGTGFFEKVYLMEEDFSMYHSNAKAEVRRKFSEEALHPVNPNLIAIDVQNKVDLGNRTIEIIPVSGHSKGSIVLLDVEAKRLFGGDSTCKAHVLFQLENAGTVEEFLKAMKGLWERREEYDLIWPGHHSYPVEKEIILQFIECTTLFLANQLPVTYKKGLLADYRLAEYKDVGIEVK